MLIELRGNTKFDEEVLEAAKIAVSLLADHAKATGFAYDVPVDKHVAFLDSLCDQIVTATGVGTFLGMNVPGGMEEVNRSNYSKFVDGKPIFNENKKVMKGPDYTPPDLTPFI